MFLLDNSEDLHMKKIPDSRILTISGPSGAGKTTLISALLEAVPGAEPLMRVTTRGHRSSDNPGEYIHLSTEGFGRWKQEGRLLFPNQNHGFQHAMLREQVERVLNLANAGIVVGDVMYTGAEQLACYAQQRNRNDLVRAVFLETRGNATELRRRMQERGDDPENIEQRIEDCRLWSQKARASTLPFEFVDALSPKQVVLEEVLNALFR